MVLKWLKHTGFKKRYILLGLLCLELASLPAAAKILSQISVSEKATASVVLIDSKDGRKRYAVATNAPFYISAEHTTGPVSVEVYKSGVIGSSRFGDNAQMPGAALACSSPSDKERVIYQSKRKTALGSGEILSQAVIVAIKYSDEFEPDFKIDVGDYSGLKAPNSKCPTTLALDGPRQYGWPLEG